MCSALCINLSPSQKNAGSIGGSTKFTRQSSMLTRLLYYRSSILAGFITLNGKKCTDLDVKLKNGDKIVHRTHRHEPPVLGGPIEVAHVDENYVIVSKPSTILQSTRVGPTIITLLYISSAKSDQNPWPLNVVQNR